MGVWDVVLVDAPTDFTVDLAAIVGSSISTGPVEVGTPAIGQVHGLTGNDIDLGAVTVGTPSVTAVSEYTAAVEVGFTFDTSSAREIEVSPDVEVGLTSEFDDSSYYVLTGDDIAVGVPTVGTPTLVEVHNLLGDAIDLGAIVLENPTIGQVHAITGSDVSLGAVTLDNSAIAGDVSSEARSRRRTRVVASFRFRGRY